jgi:23S rRNA pseudouridine1911/1915/1917 synthase
VPRTPPVANPRFPDDPTGEDDAVDDIRDGGHRLQFTLDETDAGQRLDRVLAVRHADFSRSRWQALIKEGAVLDSTPGRPGKVLEDAGHRVKHGDALTITLPAAAPPEPLGEDIPLTVVFEDAHLIVIDKPAGLVVHPGAGHHTGTLVNALIHHCGASLSGIGGVKRPGIVHRLDMDTSGLLVVAKTDAAHQGLSAQFQSHGADGRLVRSYSAICWGIPTLAKGVIEAALARSHINRTKIAVVRPAAGRHAVTHYVVTEAFADSGNRPIASLLDLQLETGRTHQIRVHMAHINHPLLGDATYGAGFNTRATRLGPAGQAALTALDRQALHARVLGFEHPVTGKALRFESALPADMAALLAALQTG